jgi:ubiquinone/menaquinone biosynthesis C-methylase UbiE
LSSESWKEVWERKGTAAAGRDRYSVEELFAADGFDTATGKTSEAGRARISDVIRHRLGIAAGQRIVEVGCGAGAVLALLADSGATLAGVDYSAPHIEIARRALPSADLRTGEACSLPFDDGTFDGVFSHGVFLYFSDLKYASRVLEEMTRVASPAARLLILDVPDAATERECIDARRAAGASLSPAHLYYPKSYFHTFAAARGRRASIFEQDIPDYGNAAFRYNVLVEREGDG